MRVITPTDIERACGRGILSRQLVRQYILDQQEKDEDGYIVFHIGENYKDRSVTHEAMMYCHEAWIIPEIGPARCIKHRYKDTPFVSWFF